MSIENLELDPNKYYFFCGVGVGDTMIACGLHKALEKKYGAPIVVVVPEGQAFIPQMFNLESYETVDLNKFNMDVCMQLSNMHPIPQKGCLYFAHAIFHEDAKPFLLPALFRKSNIRFLSWHKKFLGVPKNVSLENFKTPPTLSKEVRDAVLSIAPFDKIVIVSPEASSTELVSSAFWMRKTQELISKGYTVICNAKNKEAIIDDTVYIPMSLKDAVALAYLCHEVYSVRSGFCDLCNQLGKRLHVYYANRDDLYFYSLKHMFNKKNKEYVEYNLPYEF